MSVFVFKLKNMDKANMENLINISLTFIFFLNILPSAYFDVIIIYVTS